MGCGVLYSIRLAITLGLVLADFQGTANAATGPSASICNVERGMAVSLIDLLVQYQSTDSNAGKVILWRSGSAQFGGLVNFSADHSVNGILCGGGTGMFRSLALSMYDVLGMYDGKFPVTAEGVKFDTAALTELTDRNRKLPAAPYEPDLTPYGSARRLTPATFRDVVKRLVALYGRLHVEPPTTGPLGEFFSYWTPGVAQ